MLSRGLIVLLLALAASVDAVRMGTTLLKRSGLCVKERAYHSKLALAFQRNVIGSTFDADSTDRGRADDDPEDEDDSFETFPSRDGACSECDRWRNAHSDSTYVTNNKGLCNTCWSVKSACTDGEFQWACYDANDHFKKLAKQGNVGAFGTNSADPEEVAGYETDSGDPFFDNKEPQNCGGDEEE